ncbi:alpha-hydroxy acid oxidase [Pseudaquabacterium pictum]|uniref:Alpha-hydroxy-acid oxidizing enzyme n=1 Tax=Pseudaquabacterium pictum TaxID=2315236 RepID=A0A480B1L4_9BURK|nr:alpha-hydroxy acid oxidase [Rubrivivax pictus]GCL65755.1 alpha-hydroxy-acid oxidizing enzyme [Rubrivivax pictus]
MLSPPPNAPGPVNLADYAALARETLPPSSWAYLDGDAADGLTRADNQAAWQRLKLWPRVLRPLAGGHTRCSLLGHTWPSPLLLAPTAFHRLAHPDAEAASALAAGVLGAGYVLSTLSSLPVETVARCFLPEVQRGPLWFQLYLQPDRALVLDLLQRAEAAGCEAIVLTVDAPCQGVRDAERRAGFQLPAGVAAAHLQGHRPLPIAVPRGGSQLFDGLLHHAATWDDIAWLRAHTRLPLLLKGVLHPDDARQAAALQVDGLVVSNHGGRVLDTTPATADALPRIAEALAAAPGQAPALLVDGGIRRGTDVLKALALGAQAVLIGRPALHGLAAGGAQGVAHVLRLLRDELEAAMALTGCATLADIHPGLLAP